MFKLFLFILLIFLQAKRVNEGAIKTELKELVRNSVEETLNGLLEQEAQALTNAAKYKCSEERQGYRSGHDERNLLTPSGEVKLKVPKLKGVAFETAIIERYRHRESSVEEALIEMYLAGISVRRVSPATLTVKAMSCIVVAESSTVTGVVGVG